MCKHGFHFIHEMHYSSIAYFQGMMTGKGVKRDIGAWSWQDAKSHLCIFQRFLSTYAVFWSRDCYKCGIR
ncbi:hypothetical protein EU510_11130 [Pseudoalteromonas sp. FUC4]|nr:hypothetical protein EU510_11130 [Pseudoalteromonas sp. FUC4]